MHDKNTSAKVLPESIPRAVLDRSVSTVAGKTNSPPSRPARRRTYGEVALACVTPPGAIATTAVGRGGMPAGCGHILYALGQVGRSTVSEPDMPFVHRNRGFKLCQKKCSEEGGGNEVSPQPRLSCIRAATARMRGRVGQRRQGIVSIRYNRVQEPYRGRARFFQKLIFLHGKKTRPKLDIWGV